MLPDVDLYSVPLGFQGDFFVIVELDFAFFFLMEFEIFVLKAGGIGEIASASFFSQ